jgi:exopolysaccharide biosynthesis polyprenyl glycosylphosphotransferase
LPLARAAARERRLDRGLLRRAHLYADVVLVSAAWCGAFGLRSALAGWLGPINAAELYLAALPVVVAGWIGSCWLFGIYQLPRGASAVDEARALLRGGVLGFLVVAAIGFFWREIELGRSVVFWSAGLALGLQGANRAGFRALERRLRARGWCDARALVVGAGTTGIRLLQRIEDNPRSGYAVVGFLDDDPMASTRAARRPVLGRLSELREIAERHAVDEVVFAIPSLAHERLLALVLECDGLPVSFRMVTALFDVLTTSAPVELLDDMPLVRLGAPRTGRAYRVSKRAFDIVGAALVLVATAPLWAWIAWRIRRYDGGPALFRQLRVGRGGAPFLLWKFRTMRADTEPYAPAPGGRDDPRVTPFGRFLRRTSLDELPQVLNVLRGEMSLVGPRPEMPFIVEQYDEWQRRRLLVPPGITGLWQILGRKDLPMHANLQYDFYYIHNRSLLGDAWILLRTAWAVVSGRGAF